MRVHRPAIDALRGIAILMVVGFHAGVPGFGGAFVGVDLFFVLSGWLITGALVAELDEHESIDLERFWARRAVRLLPVLFFVLLATLALLTWLWAPIDRAAIAETARAAALSGANVHFASEGVNYFSTAEDALLHTWSLGVEEQFYVVWPLLLTLLALVSRRRMVLLVGTVGLASFVLAVALLPGAQPWAYFGMPARLWEFALGGALAVALRDGAIDLGMRRAALLQAAGVFAIALSVALYDRWMPYPGARALLPALGTAAFLVGGHAGDAAWTARAPAWLGALGRMSYAWYLWHWPLIALGAVLDPGIGATGRVLWSLLALGLAWVTYRMLEHPAREGKLARMPARTASIFAVAGSVAVALVAHGTMKAGERAAGAGVQRTYAAARADRIGEECWASTTMRALPAACVFGDPRGARTVVLFGDSHAQHWLAALDAAGKAQGWRVIPFVMGGCPVASAPALAANDRGRDCAAWRERSIRRILAMRPDAAVLSSWDHYVVEGGRARFRWQVTPREWERGLRRTYARFAAAKVPTVVMRGTPATGFDVPQCHSRRAARMPMARDCTYARADAWKPEARAAQRRALAGLPIRLVDLNDRICATDRCATVLGGTVVFTDDNHLTASFTRSLGPELAGPIRKVMAAK